MDTAAVACILTLPQNMNCISSDESPWICYRCSQAGATRGQMTRSRMAMRMWASPMPSGM